MHCEMQISHPHGLCALVFRRESENELTLYVLLFPTHLLLCKECGCHITGYGIFLVA